MRHPFPPFFDCDSRILVLGSFPSVKSREQGFFYGHKQNRFWCVMAAVFRDDVPDTLQRKKQFLTKHHIALWDVIASCEIIGSSDATITDAMPNDLSVITDSCTIKGIFVNGRKAYELYNRYLAQKYGTAVYLPSTSAANAAWSAQRLAESWKVLAEITD
ncbi:MAG: DNA-deoxyinosine glycosylase [Firmicutes bacterium]|nr:DNA-deoxyinosine glycosylase [Bacillota bacterium]